MSRLYSRFSNFRWAFYLVPILIFLTVSAFKSTWMMIDGDQPSQIDEFINFETAHVHPIDLTPDGNTLLAVNTANYSLEVFAITVSGIVHKASIPVGMDPVTVRARSNSEAWVVNAISDDISIVDLGNKVVTKSISVANEPADVVFAGNPLKAYVSSSEPSVISIFDLSNLNTDPTVVTVIGEELRALAISPDSLTVYGAFFESGNQSTLVNGNVGSEISLLVGSSNIGLGPYGNVQVPPNDGAGFNPTLGTAGLPPFQTPMIVKKNTAGQWMDDNSGNWSAVISGGIGLRVTGWDMPDRDVVVLNSSTNGITYQNHLGNILMAMDVNPATGKVSVVGTDATNEIRFEPILNGKFLRVNISSFLPGQSAQVIDLNPHLTYLTSSIPAIDRKKSLGDPRGIAWRSSGNKAYVTGMGSNNVVIIDASGTRLNPQPIEVGEGPTGIVINETLGRAYVLNKFDASISILDMNTDTELEKVDFFDPTPIEIKTGRKHLYDTHLGSGTGHISCGSCHLDGKNDRLAWDLGNPSGDWQSFPTGAALGIAGFFTPTQMGFHPMKGPKTTQTLQDIIAQDQLLHWRGDRESLADFAGAFVHLQGAESEPSATDMQEFADFLETIHFPPNPHRNLDNSFSTSVTVPGPGGTILLTGNAENGRNFFLTALAGGGQNCVNCHEANTGRSKNRLAFKDARVTGGFRGELDKMGLFYNSVNGSTSGFGFFNDGSMDSNFPFHFAQTSGDFLAFMMSFEGSDLGFSGAQITQPSQDSHAAVGKHTTVDGPFESGQQVFLNQLKTVVEGSARIGMIVTGTYQGKSRSFYYLGGDNYQGDSTGVVVTHTDLVGAANTGEPLSWLVVHDEIKERASIDRNSNGIPDGAELPIASLTMKVMMEGPFDTLSTQMNDTYRTTGVLSSLDPYGLSTSLSADLLTTTGMNAPVDWMKIELRSAEDSSIILAEKAVLVQRDGDIMDAEGNLLVLFEGVLAQPYFVAISHLNHLGIMTEAAVDLSEEPFLDFSLPTTDVYSKGGEAMRNFSGIMILWSGDANGDGAINAVDKNSFWQTENGQPYQYGTNKADFNLDGVINAVDKNALWRVNNSLVEQLP